MITSIDLSKLRNAEYVQFSKGCASIVGANDPDAMNVRGKYDNIFARNNTRKRVACLL